MSLRVFSAHDLMFMARTPAIYHCHHFNLFLDQTIDDALGFEQGCALRTRAAAEASHAYLSEVVRAHDAQTPVERLQLAIQYFGAMGHGRLEVRADENGGTARGEYLHYGHSWKEKYGAVVRRKDPADAFASGFAAAAVEVAYGLPAGSLDVKETQCVAAKSPHCEFAITPATRESRPAVDQEQTNARVQPLFYGKHREEIEGITTGLRNFTAGVAGDERGLVEAFGVFVTLHLSGYYNAISYDAVEHVEKNAPGSVGVLEELLRESGHVCVFNTFGGILLSPEWEAMVGPHTGDGERIVVGCMAIGRALGFGHWTIHEFEPGRRLVLRTPSSYESAFYLARHGVAARPNEYFLQGAALAIAQLAHRVDWTARPTLDQKFYNALFKGGLPWRAEQTQCLSQGHGYSEVVVTAT